MINRLLELEVRRRIYEFVKKHPGLHLREISRKLNLSQVLTEYHLSVLIKNELVIALEIEHYKRYYPQGKIGNGVLIEPDTKLKLSLLRKRVPLLIVLYLIENDIGTVTELSKNINVSPSTISYHITRMVNLKILQPYKNDAREGYSLVDKKKISKILYDYPPVEEDLFERFLRIWRDFTQ